MKKEEFVVAIKYLAVSYSKTFTSEEMKVWYDFFKEYDYTIFNNSIKEIIVTNKFAPSIADLKAICEKNKKQKMYILLEELKNDGYFKNENEYTKTIHFLDEGIIPEWLKKELAKSKKLLLN